MTDIAAYAGKESSEGTLMTLNALGDIKDESPRKKALLTGAAAGSYASAALGVAAATYGILTSASGTPEEIGNLKRGVEGTVKLYAAKSMHGMQKKLRAGPKKRRLNDNVTSRSPIHKPAVSCVEALKNTVISTAREGFELGIVAGGKAFSAIDALGTAGAIGSVAVSAGVGSVVPPLIAASAYGSYKLLQKHPGMKRKLEYVEEPARVIGDAVMTSMKYALAASGVDNLLKVWGAAPQICLPLLENAGAAFTVARAVIPVSKCVTPISGAIGIAGALSTGYSLGKPLYDYWTKEPPSLPNTNNIELGSTNANDTITLGSTNANNEANPIRFTPRTSDESPTNNKRARRNSNS